MVDWKEYEIQSFANKNDIWNAVKTTYSPHRLKTVYHFWSIRIPSCWGGLNILTPCLIRTLMQTPPSWTDSLNFLPSFTLTLTLYQYITEWRDANIIAFHKNKSDKAICRNTRGISLLSVAGKVLAKVLLQRLINNITAACCLNHSEDLRRTGAQSTWSSQITSQIIHFSCFRKSATSGPVFGLCRPH